MSKEKRILIDLGTVRICEYDKLNVQIEALEEVFNPTTKQKEKKWRFNTFSDTIFNALKTIIRKELLIDKNAVNSLESYLKQVKEATTKVLEVIQK